MTGELYNEAILAEARARHGHGRLTGPAVTVTCDNPLCGDRVTVDLHLDRGQVTGFGQHTRGCLLTQAAASVVGRHAAGDELLADKIAGQRDRLRLRQPPGQRQLDVARELGVMLPLTGFDLVPQRCPVQPALRRAFGKQDLRMHDASLGGEVMVAPEPLVVQLLGSPIGGSGHRATAGRAPDHLGGEMVDRHVSVGPALRCFREGQASSQSAHAATRRISAHFSDQLRCTPPAK